MRRHLVLALTLLLAAGSLTAAGVAAAGASTDHSAAKPHMTVKIVSGKMCKPASEFCFKPALATISPGTRVTFKNTTITSHTVSRCVAAACSGMSGGTGADKNFGSAGLIASSGKYVFKFKGAGTYNYYCMVHGYLIMHGTITVS